MDLSNENIIHVNKNGVQYIQFRKLLEYSDIIRHAYSLGTDVNFRTAKVNKQQLSRNEYELAINSYKNLCNAIGSNYINTVKTNQNHTDTIKIANKKIKEDEPDFNLEEYKETDGIVTNKKNLILSTTNADCILLLLFDPIKKVIANVHSGWRGTLQRISTKAIEKMEKEYNCNPKDIICCICPSIRKCHFEVEKEVKDMFEEEFKSIVEKNNIITEIISSKKWTIDTVLINQIILEEKGLKKENIIDSKICSVCNSNLVHSYRVEKERYGLETAIIELK
ncbi:MAG: peptidoglycan editing factor PgeF [Clostridia bacterium]|nr:peptidoglycan editing factor PgeF [Clostridium sp.]